MALEPLVGNQVTFYKPGKTFTEGMKLKGYFQETRESEFGKTHYFSSLDKNEGIGVNGTARLDGLMDKVQKGWLTEIEYEGKKASTKGKQPAHSFKILVDKEDTYIRDTNTPGSSSASAPTITADDIPL